jgi:fatty acid-binding protein DegV
VTAGIGIPTGEHVIAVLLSSRLSGTYAGVFYQIEDGTNG